MANTREKAVLQEDGMTSSGGSNAGIGEVQGVPSRRGRSDGGSTHEGRSFEETLVAAGGEGLERP